MLYDFEYRWTNSDSSVTELFLYRRTEHEANNIASYFGWKKPRWWQWWRYKDYVVKFPIGVKS
jgi:hypothetical protein